MCSTFENETRILNLFVSVCSFLKKIQKKKVIGFSVGSQVFASIDELLPQVRLGTRLLFPPSPMQRPTRPAIRPTTTTTTTISTPPPPMPPPRQSHFEASSPLNQSVHIPINEVYFDSELGRGSFGIVYK